MYMYMYMTAGFRWQEMIYVYQHAPQCSIDIKFVVLIIITMYMYEPIVKGKQV